MLGTRREKGYFPGRSFIPHTAAAMGLAEAEEDGGDKGAPRVVAVVPR